MTRRRRANTGSFAPGPDPRRHALTEEERSRGGRTAWQRMAADRPWLLAWLQRRIDATASAAALARYRERRQRAAKGLAG